MSRPVDLSAAARRHRRCAQALATLKTPEPAEAGYLYGFAAECAVKAITEGIPCLRRDDIFYAHFPDLRRLVIDHARGRGTESLVRLMEAGHGFMGGWSTRMRYEGNQPADGHDKWPGDAQAAIRLMEAA
jgi:hypothetical protein